MFAESLRQELLRLGTATLFEASKLPCALPSTIQAGWPGATVVGRALPVLTVAGDNLPLHLALEAIRPGDVLVVEASGSRYGYWGEVMTVAAAARGAAGLVINGCIRDIGAIEAHRFPVFAIGRSIVGTIKGTRGLVGDSIEVGSTAVSAGDIVVGDADGVVSIPARHLDDIVAAASSRQESERIYMERLRNGELTVDIYGLRALGLNIRPNRTFGPTSID
jgi:4-hydroxy-4-methyl-2-oxoglutarate aldolase